MIENKPGTILVTGGGGFLGKSIVAQLIAENYNVISFSRTISPKLKALNIQQISGDLKNYQDIFNALKGVDAVIHTASKVGMNGSFTDFYEINFLGTKNLVEAMKSQGVKKLIYTSTPSVVFGKDDIIFADETINYPKNYLSHYAHTKKLAEEYVLKNTNQSFLAVSLRPHLIYGPDDQNLIPRLIEARKKNRLKMVGDGKNLVDIIYVENAATAHLNALKRLNQNISGRAYFIGQGPVNLWNFINEILQIYKLEKVTKVISLRKAYFIGFIIEVFLKLFRLNNVHPPMSRFIALQLGKSHYFNHHQSIKDLGDYQLISIPNSLLLINNHTGR